MFQVHLGHSLEKHHRVLSIRVDVQVVIMFVKVSL